MDYTQELKLLFLMQQTYATLFSVTNKLQIKGDVYLGDLTSRQFMTMMAILHLPEDKTTLNNIAKKLGTTKQNVNTLIASIKRKGYVDVLPSPQDKRAKNARITGTGQQVLLACNEKGMDFFADVFAGFTAEELETLWSLLKKLHHSDAEEPDDFAADVSEKIETTDEYQRRLLDRFSKRRNRI